MKFLLSMIVSVIFRMGNCGLISATKSIIYSIINITFNSKNKDYYEYYNR